MKDFKIENLPKSGRKRAAPKDSRNPQKTDAESDGVGQEPKTPKSDKKPAKPTKQSIEKAKKGKK